MECCEYGTWSLEMLQLEKQCQKCNFYDTDEVAQLHQSTPLQYHDSVVVVVLSCYRSLFFIVYIVKLTRIWILDHPLILSIIAKHGEISSN